MAGHQKLQDLGKKSREEEEEGKEKQEARMFAEKLDCRLADWLQEFP